MKKALLIAEKSTLADAIREGYSHYPNKQYDITYCACSGHLMELYLPGDYCNEWKHWNIDTLPMIPTQFKNKIRKSEYPLYKYIKTNLEQGNFDVIINAGDPAREGELIVDEILKDLKCNIPELRLWTEDLTVKGICRAFDNLLQPQYNLKKAAYLRQWNDQLIGINCSRAASLATGCQISVGRVMSVITAMVVNRDKEKANFKPEEYYECVIKIEYNGNSFEGKLLKTHNDVKFYDKDEIQDYMNMAEPTGEVVGITKTSVSSQAPLLLNLTELQKEAYSKYGYSPDVTLKYAQSLYMKKLISYPRTDCRYISSNVAKELPNNLKALAQIPEYSFHISKILSNTDILNKICKHANAYVNNEQLTDHHALITTDVPATFTDLSIGEKNIYMLISRRVVAIFMPSRIINKTKLICQFGGITTISKSQEVMHEGYSELIPVKGSNTYLPELSEGDKVAITDVFGEILETKPPAYYNYRTLLEDMENCVKFATESENEDILDNTSGIGQPSTRDSIIRKLIELNYIKEAGTGKKKHLESTPEGRYIVELLQNSELISVDATARMESKLMAVEKGEYDANTYYLEMIEDVKRITEQLKHLPVAPDNNPLKVKKANLTSLICPKCGMGIKESPKGFYCSGYNNHSCNFFLAKKYYGVDITEQDIKAMFAGKKLWRRFNWKSGKKTMAKLGIENYQYKFFFEK